MSSPLLPDVLWNLIQPLLPPTSRGPKGGTMARSSPALTCRSLAS